MKYNLRGSDVFLMPEDESVVMDCLGSRTYVVKYDERQELFYLSLADDMAVPAKVYGDCAKHSKRIISTFMHRNEQTGVHLTGEKGSGKTLLAKVVSASLRELNIATIIVNNNYHGELFNTFVAAIKEPCLFLFDEYEKVYNEKEQEHMLTLFDGTRNSKKLFIVTSNDSFAVDACMNNRPSRFLYKIKYAGIDIDFVKEYIEDVLFDKTDAESVVLLAEMIGPDFNFDMLKCLIEEMNRYSSTVKEAVDILNIELTGGRHTYKIIELTSKAFPFLGHRQTIQMDMFKDFCAEYEGYESKKDVKAGNSTWQTIDFCPDDITDLNSNLTTFENEHGKIVLRKASFGELDFRNMF